MSIDYIKSSNYIIQNMQQLLSMDFLIGEKRDLWYFEKEKGNIVDINLDNLLNSNNKRYMVVAEPGYGKTRLLKEIVLQAKTFNQKAYFIDAKKIRNLSIKESIEQCKFISLDSISEESLQKETRFKNFEEPTSLNTDTVICIDALDEVAVNKLYELFEKIEDFIDEHKNIKIFLSCRTHHLQKINYDFESLDFKFISLQPFNELQIKEFIEKKLNKQIDMKGLFERSKMSNLSQFISTPRYLYYFTELLEDGSIEEVINLSRAKMFEHFIYRKLDKELHEDTPQSQIDILKRVLEKLALIMKINQVSEITKDELMSVFDKLDSNFSHIAFRDDLIAKLYDRSLIKDNVETVEFENQEFLDYLSAKELSRFEKVEHAFFDIAMEPHIVELYTSWFYVLPFLLELKPSMVELLLDFLDTNAHRVLTVEYFDALTSIEPENLSVELKSRIFDMVFDYFTNHNKWLQAFSSNITRPLARYYDATKYNKILTSVDGRKNKKDSLHVHRTNAVELIEMLIENGYLEEPQIIFWQKKITEWLRLDPLEHQYLHRNIVSSLAIISQGDIQWIKSLYFIFEKGVQVQGEYANACFQAAPNDLFSIDVYLKTKKYWSQNKKDANLSRINDEYSYILQLNTVETIMYAFKKIWEEEHFNFCHDVGLHDRERLLNNFRENLTRLYNDELSTFMKQSVQKSLREHKYHARECKKINKVFVNALLKKETMYLKELVNSIYTLKHWSYHEAQFDYLFPYIDENNFDILLDTLDGFADKKVNILLALYYYNQVQDVVKSRIFELYSKEIADKEKKSKVNKEEDQFYCNDWENMIEPEPKKFSTQLFRYFNRNTSLKNCPKYSENLYKMIIIAKNVLKSYNPLDGKIEKNGSSATIWSIDYYQDCIEFVGQEKIELEQEIRDNIFRYLPFNINSDYETTLTVAGEPSSQAIQDIIDVYSGKRDDDLGMYHIRQFVKLYNKMHLSQMEPVLLKMLENENIEEYEREYIVESLSADVLAVDIINTNRQKLDKESSLYKTYLSVLIKKHHDKNAIDEAFRWTKQRAEEIDDTRFRDPMSETSNIIAINMSAVEYDIVRDEEMLLLSSKFAQKGKNSSANFLKKIVEAHLKFLIEIKKEKSFEILNHTEKFILTNIDKTDLHWFEYQLQDLKKIYLNQVKDENIINAIKKYNLLQSKDYIQISTTTELFEVIKDTLEKDIRRWIEDEGAYKHIKELAQKDKNTNAEDFIQKTIQSQIELALLKKGFRSVDFIFKREEQLLNDNRLDFTVSYGFIGSVMIELKLSNNDESIVTRQKGKDYVKKLQSYMKGSNSAYGLFVIFNIKEKREKFNKQLKDLNGLYKDEHISILGLDCINV